MKTCIICGEATKHPSYDFCEKCFSSSIEELDWKYGKKEAVSESPEKEERQPR